MKCNGLSIGFVGRRFCWKEIQWCQRLRDVEGEERPPGLDCYCHKQMVLWSSLADEAQTKFSTKLGRPLF
jgi:hypothetical protein